MKIKIHLNTKIFSKMLAFGILINSVPINSFAGILSEDGRYETFEGSDITINNVLEEDTVDVEIEGNTLVNKLGWVTSKNDNSVTIDDNNKTISFNKQVTGFNHSVAFENATTEVNKTYTLVFNIVKNTLVNTSDNNYSLAKFNIESYNIGNYYINSGETGLVKVVLTQPSTSTNTNPYLEVYGVCEGELIIEKPYLLEGDWTSRELPEYFEGIKSVGQDDDNGHKVEILSKNKNLSSNLLDDKSEFVNYPYTENNVTFNKNQDGSISVSGRPSKYTQLEIARWGKWGTENNEITRKLCNKIMTLSTKTILPEGVNLYISYYDGTKWKQTNVDCGTNSKTFSYTDEKVVPFVVIGIRTETTYNGEPITIYPQLEVGTQATSYVPYTSNKKEIILNEPLRGLPNGVRDKIIKKNGQWVVERNCGEVIYDGSNDEVWYASSLNNDANNNMLFLTPKDDLKLENTLNDNNTVISSILKTLTPSQTNSSVQNIEGISGNTRYSEFRLNISKSKLGQANLDGLRQWLNNNPINVVYQLNEPIYEPLNINLNILLYLDTTHVSTNSTIPANLKITVDRVANRAKEYSELAKENPTIENISLARMWTNLMRESILKDEFQDNVDSITEITDMTLERKTASANLDVYIKSENALMMNLSTNSITFDDFNGVEDMVKENAVNISINSSLPYNLNAYLATEIQNSDKSNTMNKDILSIKDNSELDYQTFSSINNKVVLKSNCDSGNDKQHDINLKLNSGIAHEKDVYKTTIKFEAEQQ